MILIFIISTLLALLGFALVFKIFQIIRGRINGNILKVPKVTLAILVFGIFSLSILDGIVCFNFLKRNKDEILDLGSTVISNMVEYSTTAIFEGLGKTVDHFEDKWDDGYKDKLKKIKFEIKSVEHDSINSKILINLIAINDNDNGDLLSLENLCRDNYILVGDEDNFLYPLKVSNEQLNSLIPKGKSIMKLEGTIPTDIKIVYLNVMNEMLRIKK